MTTSESKGRFFNKTNRFESIRITNRIESIRIANWNALLGSLLHKPLDHLTNKWQQVSTVWLFNGPAFNIGRYAANIYTY